MKHSYSFGRIFLAFTLASIPFFSNAQCVNCGTGSDGAYTASSNTTLAGGTYNYSSFTINSGVTVSVTGSAPLVIYCQGAVNINGILTVNGGNGNDGVTYVNGGIGGTAVAGGYNGGDGIFSSSNGPLNGADGNGTGGTNTAGAGWSGGGGAGYETSGMSSGGVGGIGGPAYSNVQVTPIDGGSGGGGGSGGYDCGAGGGGAGGGIIRISACNGIFVNAGGAILANGGNGGSDGTGNCGGGGGGSGGTIFLATNALTNNGSISAIGGSGGASNVPGSPYYGTGAAGSNGRIRFDYSTITGSGTVTPAIGFSAAPMVAITTVTNVSCNGSCDGMAIISVTGGVPSYTYLWAPGGQTTTSINNLCAGTYTCTVTDAGGCSITETVVITQPSAMTAAIMQQNNPTCFGLCNGAATVVATGGAGPYTYSWAPNGSTAMSATGLCAGTYTVTVTDATGCITTVTFTLTEPTQINVTTTGVDESVSSACDGMAAATAFGGTPGYTYNWTPGGMITPNVTGLCAGTYTCCVTDANGCMTCTAVIIGTMNGIQNNADVNSISVYPNPAASEIGIRVPAASQLFLYNSIGELVWTKQLKEGENEMDVHELPNGIYSANIISGGITMTKKITVVH